LAKTIRIITHMDVVPAGQLSPWRGNLIKAWKEQYWDAL